MSKQKRKRTSRSAADKMRIVLKGMEPGIDVASLCRPDWPENPSSQRKLLTKPGSISKPEHQQISPRCLYAYATASALKAINTRCAS
jgi:hypothetical protein